MLAVENAGREDARREDAGVEDAVGCVCLPLERRDAHEGAVLKQRLIHDPWGLEEDQILHNAVDGNN